MLRRSLGRGEHERVEVSRPFRYEMDSFANGFLGHGVLVEGSASATEIKEIIY